MVNLKNYNGVLTLFVIFLTFFLTASCSKQNYQVSKIEGKRITITDKENQEPTIEKYIKPYREHINKDLDLGSLPKGAYFIKADFGNSSEMKKLIIE